MDVKVKLLHKDAQLPKYAGQGDAGLDLTCVSVNEEESFIEYDTGVSIEIPEGYVGLLFPRSSVSKKDIMLCNSVGVIDSSYRGSIKVRYKRTSKTCSNMARYSDYIISIRINTIHFNIFISNSTRKIS